MMMYCDIMSYDIILMTSYDVMILQVVKHSEDNIKFVVTQEEQKMILYEDFSQKQYYFTQP